MWLVGEIQSLFAEWLIWAPGQYVIDPIQYRDVSSYTRGTIRNGGEESRGRERWLMNAIHLWQIQLGTILLGVYQLNTTNGLITSTQAVLGESIVSFSVFVWNWAILTVYLFNIFTRIFDTIHEGIQFKQLETTTTGCSCNFQFISFHLLCCGGGSLTIFFNELDLISKSKFDGYGMIRALLVSLPRHFYFFHSHHYIH